jgi:hypothetical protein
MMTSCGKNRWCQYTEWLLQELRFSESKYTWWLTKGEIELNKFHASENRINFL